LEEALSLGDSLREKTSGARFPFLGSPSGLVPKRSFSLVLSCREEIGRRRFLFLGSALGLAWERALPHLGFGGESGPSDPMTWFGRDLFP
jgi:hypothetical protein